MFLLSNVLFAEKLKNCAQFNEYLLEKRNQRCRLNDGKWQKLARIARYAFARPLFGIYATIGIFFFDRSFDTYADR